MVVVDSSALIPLAWIGRLDLLSSTFDTIRTSEAVRDEVLTTEQRGAATLRPFLDGGSIHASPPRASEVAELEGIAVADAAVILLASDTEEVLLSNDKALIEVARSHGVDGWWVTTLLLKLAADGTVSAAGATDVLDRLVDEGLYLHPKVYARVRKVLRERGD